MVSIAGEISEPDVSVGRVIGRGLRAVAANPIPVATLAFLFGAAPEMLLVYALSKLDVGAFAGLGRGSNLGLLLSILSWVATSVAFGTLLQGLLARAMSADALSGRVRELALLAEALGRAPKLLALGAFTALCIVAVAPLIVPAVMLCLAWAVAGPVLAEEGGGSIAALRRSAELTRGVRWRVLGLTLVLFLFSAAGVAVTGLMGRWLFVDGNSVELAASGAWHPGKLAFDAAALTAVRAVWGAVQAALYGELRAAKVEGAPDRLATIFA